MSRTVWKSNEYEEAESKLEYVFEFLLWMEQKKELGKSEARLYKETLKNIRQAIVDNGTEEID